MSVRPIDTASEAWSVQSAALDRIGGAGRFSAAIELSQSVREIRMAGMQSRHPELSIRQLIRLLVREEYGVDLPDTG